MTTATEWKVGDFAGTPGYFERKQWHVDRTMNSLSVGKIVRFYADVTGETTSVTLEFAAKNTVTLGVGLLYPVRPWEIESFVRMRSAQ